LQCALDRRDQQVVGTRVAEDAAVRTADRRAAGRDDVGVLNLLAHVQCSDQLRTGLPVCRKPITRSWVLGCSSKAQKCLRSSVIRYSSVTSEPASTSPPQTTSAI